MLSWRQAVVTSSGFSGATGTAGHASGCEIWAGLTVNFTKSVLLSERGRFITTFGGVFGD